MEFKDIIIDFEFTGIDKFEADNEIIGMSYYEIHSDKKESFIFNSKKENGVGSFLCNGITKEEQKGKPFFSKDFFIKIFGENYNDNFYIFFASSEDKSMLSKYDIFLNKTKDYQNILRLMKKYEKDMATQGCSLECCAKYVIGDYYAPRHKGTEEVELIKLMITKTGLVTDREYLSLYPWGYLAGMPLDQFCEDYRRNADGYRYNNNDLLSDSLDSYCYLNN